MPQNKGRQWQESLLLNLTAVFGVLQRDVKVFWKNFRGNSLRIIFQPLAFLLVFGLLLPRMGLFSPEYAGVLFPGVIAISTMYASIIGVAGPLGRSLAYNEEIRDQILAPVSVWALAFEKVLMGIFQSLMAGGTVLLMGWIVFGRVPPLDLTAQLNFLGMLFLSGVSFASLGLIIASLLHRLDLMWEVLNMVTMPFVFFGATFFPREDLALISPALKYAVLLIPTTYTSEGLRGLLTPEVVHMGPAAVYAGLLFWAAVFLSLGIWAFRRRVIL